ncbi:DHH family phosphoesterase [Mycoplasma zalophidermidis]|nr:DHHA1 domain-containing protein [Mycoplasma zalophidermidis]
MNMKEKFKKFWEIINQHEYVTLCTHTNPDGDTIGSAVAFKEIIELNCENVKEVKISGGDCPRNLNFLFENRLSLVDDEFFDKSLVVVVDTSVKKRIFDKRVITEESLKFDHHPCEEKWKFEIGGDYWPATGQLLTEMVMALNLKLNQKALKGLAVAILTDTNNFTERNISSTTFSTMSYLLKQGLEYKEVLLQMQLNKEEKKLIFETISTAKTEGIITYVISREIIPNDIARPLVNSFLDITDTEVSLCILKNVEGKYRCSIRSRSYYDVNKIANYFGGGGHKNSSGFFINSLDQLSEVVTKINSK